MRSGLLRLLNISALHCSPTMTLMWSLWFGCCCNPAAYLQLIKFWFYSNLSWYQLEAHQKNLLRIPMSYWSLSLPLLNGIQISKFGRTRWVDLRSFVGWVNHEALNGRQASAECVAGEVKTGVAGVMDVMETLKSWQIVQGFRKCQMEEN